MGCHYGSSCCRPSTARPRGALVSPARLETVSLTIEQRHDGTLGIWVPVLSDSAGQTLTLTSVSWL